MNVASFLRTSFSIEHLRWLLLCLLEREEEESMKQKSKEKFFKWKKKNENISFNFYPQVLVLVKTEMQIQPCKCKYNNTICYRTAHFFSYTFFKFSFLWFVRVHFLCFHSCQTEKYLLLDLLAYSEAGIESCSVKQLFGKI